MSHEGDTFLVVKLAAAGDVLLTTALTRALRRAHPRSTIGWITSRYAAPLLERNPDLDELIPLPLGGAGWGARGRAGWAWLRALLAWRRRHGQGTVLLAHRSPHLAASVRALAGGKVLALGRDAPFRTDQHRLEWQAGLLRAAGIEADAFGLQPVLALSDAERQAGEAAWQGAPAHPRWVIAPGGANNPWSAMPNRCWPRERFLALASRARATGVALRWMGGPADVPLIQWICERLPPAAGAHGAGSGSLRQSAAVIAAADLVIGNDSLPLVMAHAVGRPALGLYGPTAGALIHAFGEPLLQGKVVCGPCYDPRDGVHGRAYTCTRARCMEDVTLERVWQCARFYLPRPQVAHAR
ncbi:MAG: glycosyltransferase family 9 protein [Terriglobales bacterium]